MLYHISLVILYNIDVSSPHLPPLSLSLSSHMHAHRKKFNIDVLHKFVHHHKFHGLDLVGALRYG